MIVFRRVTRVVRVLAICLGVLRDATVLGYHSDKSCSQRTAWLKDVSRYLRGVWFDAVRRRSMRPCKPAVVKMTTCSIHSGSSPRGPSG